MADPKTEQEPSIEEILESIRQIISEDGEETPAPMTATQPASNAPKEDNAVPLDLTPTAEALGNDVPLDLTPADAGASMPSVNPDLSAKSAPAERASDDILELTEKVAAPPSAVEPLDLTSTTAMDPPMTTNDIRPENTSAIISEPVASAATEALAKLLAGSMPIDRKEGTHITLEDIARDMMKPLLKAWIDQNLPGLVEKIVQREVEKLSRRASDN